MLSEVTHRLALTLKKARVFSPRRDPQERARFSYRIADYTARQLVFIDETSVAERALERDVARSKKGRRSDVVRRAKRKGRYSLLSAITTQGHLASKVVLGGFKAEDVLAYLEERLVGLCTARRSSCSLLNSLLLQLPLMRPYPEPFSVIVLDNCNIHHSAAVREAIEARGELKLIPLLLHLSTDPRLYRLSRRVPTTLLSGLQPNREALCRPKVALGSHRLPPPRAVHDY